MKKQKYVKPAMQVVEVKQQPQLLAGSNGQATLQNYIWVDELDE